ncbi:hypothetical protein PPL_05438 [Heterostelium album PN500]|uniref:Uncharacterized protein n=1 Tax=Heterostelium pallidum (strain ATCC 26659 / Pp 5 / PN500) TaxID=670386 RepID=D3BA63_HETP5|nr:hypothetical protein PPL_05438 [Heterostelium album PN500]EFA81450.1 hypothetical protein PPL_05438 [Heterostelium album PN500]|eukprot:XP_020433568.1 hypothetical protein PPL_05438 [Heterostelium album PN500]
MKEKGKDGEKASSKSLLSKFASKVSSAASTIGNFVGITSNKESTSLVKIINEYLNAVSVNNKEVIHWEERILSSELPKSEGVDTVILKQLTDSSQKVWHLQFYLLMKYTTLIKDVPEKSDLFQSILKSRGSSEPNIRNEKLKDIYYQFLCQELDHRVSDESMKSIIVYLTCEFFNIHDLNGADNHRFKEIFQMLMVHLDRYPDCKSKLHLPYSRLRDNTAFLNLYSIQYKLFSVNDVEDFKERFDILLSMLKVKRSSKFGDAWYNFIKDNLKGYCLTKLLCLREISPLLNPHLDSLVLFTLLVKFPDEFEKITTKYNTDQLTKLGNDIYSQVFADIKDNTIEKYMRFIKHPYYGPMFIAFIEKKIVIKENDIIILLVESSQDYPTLGMLQSYSLSQIGFSSASKLSYFYLMVPSYSFTKPQNTNKFSHVKIKEIAEEESKFVNKVILNQPMSQQIFKSYFEFCNLCFDSNTVDVTKLDYVTQVMGHASIPCTLPIILYFNWVLSNYNFKSLFTQYTKLNRLLAFIVPNDYPHWNQQVLEYREKREMVFWEEKYIASMICSMSTLNNTQG